MRETGEPGGASEQLRPPNVEIVDDGVRLEISIRARRRMDLVGFLVGWVFVWSFLGVGGIWSLAFKGETLWPGLAIWLLVWGAGEFLSTLALLYYLIGRDVVTAEPGWVAVREQALGLGINRRFNVDDVEILELADREELRARGLDEASIDDNSMWFEHKGKMFSVGSGMKLAQAERYRRQIITRAK